MKRVVAVSMLAGIVLLGCQDQPTGPIEPTGELPSFQIQDGNNPDGNQNVYWLAPIRRFWEHPPRSLPFDDDLNLTFKICKWVSGACSGTVWSYSAGASLADWLRGRGIRVFPELQEYSLLWITKGLNLDATKTYRIRALVGNQELAFADVDVFGSLRELLKVDFDNYAPLAKNGVLPIRLFVAEGALCDPNAQSCVSQTIDITQGGMVSLPGEDESTVAVVNVPATTSQGGNMTTVTVQQCATPNGNLSSLIDIPLYGDCVEITAEPPLALATPATASLCAAPSVAATQGVLLEQRERMTVHRASLQSNQTFTVVALPHSNSSCPGQGAMNLMQRVERLAMKTLRALRERVVAMVSPDVLWASMMRCNRGGCGSPTPFESSFQVALPSWMSYHENNPDGNLGAYPVGTVVTAKIRVKDSGEFEPGEDEGPTPLGVKGARLTVSIPQGGSGMVSDGMGGGFSNNVTILSDANGVAKFQLQVGAGTNTVSVTGRGVGVVSAPNDMNPVDNVFAPSINNESAPEVTLGTGTLTFIAEALTLVGNAAMNGNNVRLTPASTGQRGAAWIQSRKTLTNGFTAQFSFQISSSGGIANPNYGDLNNTGADGIAFVIQDDQTNQLGAIGASGGGIGYDGIPRSLAVEFDTWLNTEWTIDDPNGNHVAVHSKGTAANSADESAQVVASALATPATNLSSGEHTAVVTYVPGNLKVFVDNVQLLNLSVTLTNIGGSSILDGTGKAWVGFTAATGQAIENHDVFKIKISIP